MRIAVAGMLAVVSWPVSAEDVAPKPSEPVPCFEAIPATANVAPLSPILVDRCTGRTWLLVRSNIADAKGKTIGFAYRWHPVVHIEDEAILVSPELPRAPASNADITKRR
jgi:hypothetical protein